MKLSGVLLFDHSDFAVRPIDHNVIDLNYAMLGSLCECLRVTALGELEGFVFRVSHDDDAS